MCLLCHALGAIFCVKSRSVNVVARFRFLALWPFIRNFVSILLRKKETMRKILFIALSFLAVCATAANHVYVRSKQNLRCEGYFPQLSPDGKKVISAPTDAKNSTYTTSTLKSATWSPMKVCLDLRLSSAKTARCTMCR